MSALQATPLRTAMLAAVAVTLAACGGHATRAPALPPAAEPASAPPASARPAGRSVLVGPAPEGIVVDGKTGLVVVAIRNPPQLVLLSARTGHVQRRIPIAGAPRHLELARPGGPVLVPEEPVDRLLELMLPNGRFRSIPVGAHPHAAAAAAAGGTVFAGDEFGHSISVIEGDRVTARIGGFVQPGGLVAAGAGVAVVDVRTNRVSIVDARRLRIVAALGAGAGPTHAVADASGRLFVVDTRGGAVFTYGTRPSLRQLGRLPLPGAPYGAAIDPARGRLWLTLTAKDELVELATGGSALRVIGVYPTGRQPNTVAVNPRDGRVFVANAGPGTVQLVDPRH